MPETNIGHYDARNVTVVVGGQYLTGYGEGTFVEWEKDEDNFETSVSAMGDVGVATVNNTLGTVTITLMQTSPSVSYMNALANSGEIISFYAKHSGTPEEEVSATQARVLKPAASAFSNAIETREFEIRCFDFTQK